MNRLPTDLLKLVNKFYNREWLFYNWCMHNIDKIFTKLDIHISYTPYNYYILCDRSEELDKIFLELGYISSIDETDQKRKYLWFQCLKNCEKIIRHLERKNIVSNVITKIRRGYRGRGLYDTYNTEEIYIIDMDQEILDF